MTPEETRWLASTRDPQKAGYNLKLQYRLLAIWCALTIAWIALVVCGADTFSWTPVIVLLAGFFNCIIGIINNKRILQNRKPWGDI